MQVAKLLTIGGLVCAGVVNLTSGRRLPFLPLIHTFDILEEKPGKKISI